MGIGLILKKPDFGNGDWPHLGNKANPHFQNKANPYLPPVGILKAHDIVLPEIGPDCTSTRCNGTLPGFSSRCVVPIGMKVDSFSPSRNTSSPRVTRAVPCTTIQCSARW